MKNKRYLTIILSVCLLCALSCATRQNDPLKNTRKLVKEGHTSLYKNGAFQVPESSIYLIPPGPSATEFALELMGLRARQAFLKSVKQASESVYIVSAGTKLSYKAASATREAGNDAADYIRTHSREDATLLMDRSMAKGKSIMGDSWTLSKELLSEMSDIGNGISESSSDIANRMDTKGTKAGKDMIASSQAFSKNFYKDRTADAKKSGIHAMDAFVSGYVAVPKNLKSNFYSAGENLDKANLADIIGDTEPLRSSWSGKSVDLMGSAVGNYADNVKGSFSKAGSEFDQRYTTGLPLATLKAMRWVLKGILWDATVEPAAKLTTGGLGFVAVNCLAWPVIIVEKEGKAVTRIAVDVTWNTSKSAYQLIAPSGEASLAGIYSLLEYSSGTVVAGSAAVGGTIAGASEAGAAKAGGLIIRGSGAAAGKVTQYVGVPLAAAGVATAGTTVGAAVMAGGATSSGTVYVGGETTALTTKGFGNIIAGTTLVTGTAASTAGGAAYGVYQLSKAVVVPSGYELGGGVVLSYETMSQISAQAILAVSDCAYLVLSLEGPRWVVYAVKGKLGKGDDLVPGTVLDLEKMKNRGEEILNLPVSDEEMKKIVTSTYKTLPEVNGNGNPAEPEKKN